MTSRSLYVVLLLVFTAPLVASEAGAEGENVALLVLPEGDPAAGRQAFVDLMCTSCHRVAGDTDLPQPISATPGPKLKKKQGRQSTGELATSIIAPSHRMTDDVLKSVEGARSPMGDFGEAMTVRQLIDLVAYLDSLDEKD